MVIMTFIDAESDEDGLASNKQASSFSTVFSICVSY